MDDDLGSMSREQLVDEVIKLRQGIGDQWDNTGHSIYGHHSELWELLPEWSDSVPAVPAWSVFIRARLRYRKSLDEQRLDGGARVTKF
jgi:hypothetical protein